MSAFVVYRKKNSESFDKKEQIIQKKVLNIRNHLPITCTGIDPRLSTHVPFIPCERIIDGLGLIRLFF